MWDSNHPYLPSPHTPAIFQSALCHKGALALHGSSVMVRKLSLGLGGGGSGSLHSAPPFLAPSPFPLGSLPNPLTLRVTSLGPGTRCFIFSLPPPPLGSSLKCREGDPWAGVLSLPLRRPLFPALFHSLSLLGVPLYYPLTLHSLLGLCLRPRPCSVDCSPFLFISPLRTSSFHSPCLPLPCILSGSFFSTFPPLSFLSWLFQRAGTARIRGQRGRSWLLSSHPGGCKLLLSLGRYSPPGLCR